MCINISSYGLGHNWERTACKMPEYYLKKTWITLGIQIYYILLYVQQQTRNWIVTEKVKLKYMNV
jgi:hypothetical protein